MKFSKKLLTVGLLSVSLIASGCSKKESTTTVTPETTKSSNIVIAVEGEPERGFNPLYAGDKVGMTVMNAVYNPLFEIETNGDKTFYLADDIKVSDDFLTYTVTLKKDLKWHDGTALTADDVVFTVNTILDENQATTLRSGFMVGDNAVEVNKIDDNTVEFKLSEVSSVIEGAIGGLRPIPKHIYEGITNVAEAEQNNNPIGNGAYKFKEYKSGELITLERFDDYYGDKANLETVVFRIIPDENASNIALLNGEVQINSVQADQIDGVLANGNIDLVTYDSGLVDNLIFMQRSNDILKNKEVRQAICYAINKEEVIQAAYKSTDYADKASSLFPPDTIDFTSDVEKYDRNVEKAKELLKNAGAENITLRLAYGTHKATLESMALVIQSNLKDVGINVELKPMERSAYISDLLSTGATEFDLGLNGYMMGTSPSDYESLFVTGGGDNYGGYSNSEVDAKFEEAKKEPDAAKRRELYKEIQQTIVEDPALVPLSYKKAIIGVDKNYGGVEEAKPNYALTFRDLNKLKLK